MTVDGIGRVRHPDVHVVEICEQLRQVAYEAQICRPQGLMGIMAFTRMLVCRAFVQILHLFLVPQTQRHLKRFPVGLREHERQGSQLLSRLGLGAFGEPCGHDSLLVELAHL